MSGGSSGGDYGSASSAGDTVTNTGNGTVEVRHDSSALGMPYHTVHEIDTETGESQLKESGHF